MSISRKPIEIIGGGLAGLSLGLGLARRGVPTTVVDAGDYPRHRVCGEFITGLDDETTRTLDLVPFLADALPHWETAWFVRGRAIGRRRLPAPARGISRHTLDARLAEAFSTAGGTLITGVRVTDLAPRPGRVVTTGRRRSRSPWIGLKVHVRDLDLAADLELHLGRRAYVGLSRTERGEINVCGLFHRGKTAVQQPDPGGSPRLPATDGPTSHRAMLEHLNSAGLGELAARLQTAVPVNDSFCAVAGLAFDATIAARSGFALGDALAMPPPFTGNGMAMAFQAAATALEPLASYSRGTLHWDIAWQRTVAALRHRFRRRLTCASALHPFLLRRSGQVWLAALSRSGLLPFHQVFRLVH